MKLSKAIFATLLLFSCQSGDSAGSADANDNRVPDAGDATSTIDGGNDVDDGGPIGDAGDVLGDSGQPACPEVTLSFRAEVLTIAGTPFGLESGIDSGRMASGTMTYRTCILDSETIPSTTSGDFDHVSGPTAVFTFALDAPSSSQTVSLEMTGSGMPLLRIRGLDYFDYNDGGYDVFNKVERYAQVNGALDTEAEFSFTIGAGSVNFDDDTLPESFPYSGQTEDDFDCIIATDYCVTFSIKESTFGDVFLMRLHSLTQVEQP